MILRYSAPLCTLPQVSRSEVLPWFLRSPDHLKDGPLCIWEARPAQQHLERENITTAPASGMAAPKAGYRVNVQVSALAAMQRADIAISRARLTKTGYARQVVTRYLRRGQIVGLKPATTVE
ncbi:MAG: hypothetical protein NTZ56_09615 [Acidobacteria bacterium]|nr:hypothetical protein [Acidobacteriota bacterium]